MPMTIPPRIWLRPVFKLINAPAILTLTQRVTSTSGSSGSIFTSQNCAPKLWNPSLLLSLKSNFPSASSEFIPLLFSVSVNDSGLSGFAPRSVSFFFKLAAASAMAEPTVAVVFDPPATGPKGKAESPSSNFTFSTGIPMASALIYVSDVH